MRLTAFGRLAAVPLAALLAAPALAEEPAAVVQMTNQLNYEPPRVEIEAGQTVEWRNVSDLVHTVTADPELANDPSHVRLPEGAETFNSGDLAPGASWTRSFDVPGEYTYFCIPHEAAGMIGEIVVR